jgi:hypothetical protein
MLKVCGKIMPLHSECFFSYCHQCEDYYYTLHPLTHLTFEKLHGFKSGKCGGWNHMLIILSPKHPKQRTELFAMFKNGIRMGV